jgi:hypothetical protein
MKVVEPCLGDYGCIEPNDDYFNDLTEEISINLKIEACCLRISS